MKTSMTISGRSDARCQSIFGNVSSIIDAARRSVARWVNTIKTAACWLIGRHIVEFEEAGKKRADHGEEIIERLVIDLAARYARRFSIRNVWVMRAFHLSWSNVQTLSVRAEGGGIS